MWRNEINHDLLGNRWMTEYINPGLHELLLSDLNFYKEHMDEYTEEVFPKILEHSNKLSSGKIIQNDTHIVIGGLCHLGLYDRQIVLLDEEEIDEFCCYFRIVDDIDNDIMINLTNYENLYKFRVGKWDDWIKKYS